MSLATIVSLVMASAAFADTLLGDSDAVTNGNQTNVFLDSAAEGLTATFNVALAIECASKASHIDGDTTVSMDVGGSTIPSGATMTAASVTIARPSTWPLDGVDCPAGVTQTASQNSLVTLTVPAAGVNDTDYTFQLRWSVSDPDVKQVSGANVSIKYTVRGTGGGGEEEPPTDTAPTVNAGADVNGAEGSAISLDASVTDDGTVTTAWTYAIVSADAGASCSFANATAVDTTITCTDDGTYTATLTTSDGVNSPVSDSATVTVSNAIPVPNAGADQTVNEGDLVSLNGSFTDAGLNDTATQSWSVVDSDLNVIASSTTGSASFRPGDNDIFTATYTVTDDDGGSATDSATITVNNVIPTTSGATFAADLTTAFKFNASFNYSDPGWLDTHTGSIVWTVTNSAGTGTGTSATFTYPDSTVTTPDFATGTVASSLTLAPGCYTFDATGTVTDDDGGESATVNFNTGHETTPLDVPTAAFLAPIKDNERNFAKWGNVLPVKVSLMSSCNPGQPLVANLYLAYIQGTGNETITGTEEITTSVSAADTGNQMRLNESFYIYNFSTKPLGPGKDYTLRVRYGSATGPVILSAVLQLKK